MPGHKQTCFTYSYTSKIILCVEQRSCRYLYYIQTSIIISLHSYTKNCNKSFPIEGFFIWTIRIRRLARDILNTICMLYSWFEIKGSSFSLHTTGSVATFKSSYSNGRRSFFQGTSLSTSNTISRFNLVIWLCMIIIQFIFVSNCSCGTFTHHHLCNTLWTTP